MNTGNVCIHTQAEEYYSATKNKILSIGAKWMKLEDVMLSEINQTQKKIYQKFSLYSSESANIKK